MQQDAEFESEESQAVASVLADALDEGPVTGDLATQTTLILQVFISWRLLPSQRWCDGSYHGSGAQSTPGYPDLSSQVATRYAVATYLVDIRGHGSSAGSHGDAPSIAQLWDETGLPRA